jgi:phosphoglucomutase/phosphomannomutase
LLCELVAKLKAAGQTLHEKLDALFWQHGVHVEKTINVQMPGSEGMARMMEVMQSFRSGPPTELGGQRVQQIRDYELSTVTAAVGPPSQGGQAAEGAARLAAPTWGKPQPLDGPVGDLIILDLAVAGNYVACRPSGTEPKIKFYLFGYVPPEQLSNLEAAKSQLHDRLARIEADLRKFAGV